MKRFLVICVILLIVVANLFAQNAQSSFIQIDGLTADEQGYIVPDVSIYSKHLRRGAASDHRGIFSIISIPGDTVFFSAIGYKSTLLTIPVTISGNHYITDVMMVTDTIMIGEVLVLPWKTYSEFKRAVLENKTIDPLIANMEYNLALIEQQVWSDMRPTPGQAYRYTMQQMSDNLYTRGQMPTNNLLNPFAWQKFVKGVKNGLLKNEPSTTTKVKKIKTRKKKKKE
ncbi:MAG: carboxypeptidase-like regulatory domain-containing protein [Bacteroidales bacterium]|nr:carboxypeptidase-like regulatory domain-containing protein [Bacteroidales bacterium]